MYIKNIYMLFSPAMIFDPIRRLCHRSWCCPPNGILERWRHHRAFPFFFSVHLQACETGHDVDASNFLSPHEMQTSEYHVLWRWVGLVRVRVQVRVRPHRLQMGCSRYFRRHCNPFLTSYGMGSFSIHKLWSERGREHHTTGHPSLHPASGQTSPHVFQILVRTNTGGLLEFRIRYNAGPPLHF